MAIRKLTKDLNIISALPNDPNDEGGLSAAALKAKFDESGNTMKEYINETLIPDLGDEIASEINAMALASGNLPKGGKKGQLVVKALDADLQVEYCDVPPLLTGANLPISAAVAGVVGSAANVDSALITLAQTAMPKSSFKVGEFTIASTTNNSAGMAVNVNLGGTPKAVFLTKMHATAPGFGVVVNLPLEQYNSFFVSSLANTTFIGMMKFTSTGFSTYATLSSASGFDGTIKYFAVM